MFFVIILIGFISVTALVETTIGTNVSLHYATHPAWQRNNHAFNVLNALINYLKYQQIDNVILSIDNENKASINLAKKLDFELIFPDEDESIYKKRI